MDKLENQETKTPAKQNNITNSIKNHKKLFITITLVIVIAVLAVLTFFILDIANDVALTNRIKPLLDGKTYIEESTYYSRVYTFNGDTLGYEQWDFDTYSVYGDINEACPYKVNGSLGKNNLQLLYEKDGRWCSSPSIELCDDGSVNFLYGKWNETTIDEINALRKVTLCKHVFGNVQTIKKATCSSKGQEKQSCNICGYEQIQETEKLEHNYVNKICSECGAKKQPQKAYNIEPNTWYTYQEVLHFQNIKLLNAFSVSQGKGMSVSYKFVCQHCHVIDETMRANVPEYNFKIYKTFTCEECGGLTAVKIELG